jgi:predicted PurR-regulated permease PerM
MHNLWMNRLIISGLIVVQIYLLFQLSGWLDRLWQMLCMVIWPFVLAWLLHYAFYPLTRLFSQRGMSQTWATVIVYFCAVTSLTVIGVNAFPRLLQQWQEWRSLLPGWTVQAHQMVEQWKSQPQLPDAVQNGLNQALFEAEQWVSDSIRSGIAHLPETANGFLLLFVVPFLLFYFLKENGEWSTRMGRMIPFRWQLPVKDWMQEVDESIGGYVRGQFIVCILIGITAYIGYQLIGLPSALLLAVFAGVLNIIPYVGPLISMIPAWLAASTVSWEMLIWVTLLNVGLQIIEGYLLAPWIVGRVIEAHPLLILFALIAGAEWAGVWGLLLSIPLLIVLKITWKHLLRTTIVP